MDINEEPRVNAWKPSSEPRPHPSAFWRSIREWAQVIIVALLISLPIRFFIAEPFVVDGASMDPAFATGQFLIVDRLSYRLNDPIRGDVTVFKYPNDPSVYYIKRIIGLPGETVTITNGKISIINTEHPKGFTLDEPYIDSKHVSRDSLTMTLKPSQYFVMGDNRSESSDSRIWGPLEENLIIGRPIVRLFPITKVSFLPGEYHEQTK